MRCASSTYALPITYKDTETDTETKTMAASHSDTDTATDTGPGARAHTHTHTTAATAPCRKRREASDQAASCRHANASQGDAGPHHSVRVYAHVRAHVQLLVAIMVGARARVSESKFATTRACNPANTRACFARARTLACMCTHQVCAHGSAHAQTLTYAHMHMHAHTHAHTYTYILRRTGRDVRATFDADFLLARGLRNRRVPNLLFQSSLSLSLSLPLSVSSSSSRPSCPRGVRST